MSKKDKAEKSRILFSVGDITKVEADAIVNAANNSLLGGGGVDGAIHRAAGPGLLEECMKLGGCETGKAKITGGHKLPSRYVIHTVGPIYSGSAKDPALLYSCYAESLDLAAANDVHRIAFPCISTGVYGYPREKAAVVALKAIVNWIDEHKDYPMEVMIVCYSPDDMEVYRKVMAPKE